MLMLGFGFPVMRMLLRAGLGVSHVQMKRGMGVAIRKCEGQQQDQAAQEERPLHGTFKMKASWPPTLPRCGSSAPMTPSRPYTRVMIS